MRDQNTGHLARLEDLDDLKVAELKRRKLQLKDEITKLKQTERTVH